MAFFTFFGLGKQYALPIDLAASAITLGRQSLN